MNKYIEYLHLIPKGISNFDKVIEGVINTVKMNYDSLPEEKKKIIIERRLICHSCPFNSINCNNKINEEYYSLYKEHYTSSRPDEHCSICSCKLELKTAALQVNCGIEYWNSNNEKQLELKWKSI